jgi:hypothetical protein
MAGPSKKMRVNDEVFYELLKGMNTVIFQRVNIVVTVNVKLSLGGEQGVSSDEAENVSDNSSMQSDVWANLGAECPHFSFTSIEDQKTPVTTWNIFSCFVHQTLWK